MKKNFLLDKETVLKANTYLDMPTKRTLIDQIAEKCIVEIKIDDEKQLNILVAPKMCGVDEDLKAMLLMSVFLSGYLNIEIDGETFNGKTYDFYAGSHIFNQLEKFKLDKDTRDIVYTIMNDYRDFVRLVDSEIKKQLSAKNDILNRVVKMLELSYTPENVQGLIEMLKQKATEIVEKGDENAEE